MSRQRLSKRLKCKKQAQTSLTWEGSQPALQDQSMAKELSRYLLKKNYGVSCLLSDV